LSSTLNVIQQKALSCRVWLDIGPGKRKTLSNWTRH